MPNQEAKSVAEVLIGKFFSRFGIPRELHSDQGPNFESRLFQEVCKLLGIRKTRTTPYHPSGDGMVERFNRTLIGILRAYVSKDQSDWDLKLPMVTMAYRSSVQETTGFTPNRLMLGREINIPLTLMVEPPPDTPPPTLGFIEKLQSDGNEAFELVKIHVKQQQRKQKIGYDKKIHGAALEVGQKVWRHTPRGKRGLSPKLLTYWQGPFIIEEKLSEVNFLIGKPNSRNRQVVHFNRLKPFFERGGNPSESVGWEPTPVEPNETSSGAGAAATFDDPLELLVDEPLGDPTGSPRELSPRGPVGSDSEIDNPLELELEEPGGSLWATPDRRVGRRRRRPPDWMRSGAYDLT